MDWARDHLDNDVPAWQGGISGFGLKCPSCGEPVRRRAGGERRPHFAHYSHRAKPDCENYFPAQGSSSVARVGISLRLSQGRWNRESLTCGLFLSAEAGRTSLALWLRIPPVDLGVSAVGRLEVQSGLGHRTYQLTDLSAARLVPMAPQVPLATVAGFGDLLPFAAELAGQVGAFAPDRNLFYADEKGGRFIFADEQLEWGARYRLLSRYEVAPTLELGSALRWKPEGKFGSWHSYELALPTAFAASKIGLPGEIAEFLGHRISNPRPRLYVVDPPPHHIEIGGTYVYPVPPNSLLLRRHGNGEPSVCTLTGMMEIAVSEQGNEWVRVSAPWREGCEYVVAIGGNEQLIFRVEPCDLFRPGGVTVSSDDIAWDLCSDAPLAASRLAERAMGVDCGSARIAAHLARLNDGWLLAETQLSLPSGAAKNLRAGSFGELRGVVASQSGSGEGIVTAPAARPSQPVAVSLWIEHLVLREYGVDGASLLRRYLASPSLENLYRLGPIMTSRLMPYIRAAQHQHRDRTRGDQGL